MKKVITLATCAVFALGTLTGIAQNGTTTGAKTSKKDETKKETTTTAKKETSTSKKEATGTKKKEAAKETTAKPETKAASTEKK